MSDNVIRAEVLNKAPRGGLRLPALRTGQISHTLRSLPALWRGALMVLTVSLYWAETVHGAADWVSAARVLLDTAQFTS